MKKSACRDYHLLARAVACPYCGAEKGAKCFGSRPDTRIQSTHCGRRSLAAEARKGQGKG
jgi:hypothetical protein